MKLVNVNVDLMQAFVTISKNGIMTNVNVKAKNWLTKEYMIKDLFGIQVVEDYLDYEKCKCRKRLVDKLFEECTENMEEVKLAKIISAEHESVCKSFCALYIVLFSIIFRINVGIGTYFVYYKYMNRDKEAVAKELFIYQTTI